MVNSLPKIDTYHLLIFDFVCSEKSISGAAKKLFLSQPAVTSHIKNLEDSIQVKLIQIERKKLTLTQAGEGLYRYTQEILRQTLAADRFIEIIKASSLFIGVSSLLVKMIARSLTNMPKRLDPLFKLEVIFGEGSNLVKSVIDSKIDIAVIPRLDYGFSNLSHVKVAENAKLVFFSGASHPIFKNQRIGWPDLADYPLLIGTESSSIKKLVSNRLIAEGLKTLPRFFLTGYNSEFFKTMVRSDNFISLTFEEEIREELDQGVLREVPVPGTIALDIEVVAYDTHISTPLIQQFIACLGSLKKTS